MPREAHPDSLVGSRNIHNRCVEKLMNLPRFSIGDSFIVTMQPAVIDRSDSETLNAFSSQIRTICGAIEHDRNRYSLREYLLPGSFQRLKHFAIDPRWRGLRPACESQEGRHDGRDRRSLVATWHKTHPCLHREEQRISRVALASPGITLLRNPPLMIVGEIDVWSIEYCV